ncbi:hypothetical protein O181_060204 [Austropuccinia psidii MF-1]|uniref:BED-type domain-containing protein n=1 Tax=Austropuccinia psidii MF-1 TaxID=1389203 RepID=A0A9Q3EFV4_9BASI|nr:hypothetical protein [Austropuccinia psidii MF-1]
MSSTHPSQPSSPDTDVATQPSTAEPINSLKRSWVWVYFSDTDEQYVHCNITNASGKTCNKKLKHDKTGSTKAMSQHLNLSHHLTNPKSEALVKGQNLTLDKFVKTRHVKQSLCAELLKTALVYFICENDLPLSMTESTSFRTLLELCNPTTLNILVCRTALTAHLSNVFFFHQEAIRKSISNSSDHVSFTTDTWTSPNIIAYMAVTAHFLDEQFNLMTLLLGLSKIEGNHSGPSLAKLFFKIINQYNLEDRMFGLTTDNASVNHRMAMAIESKIPTFRAKTHSVGCMAHTLHLAARNGLNSLGISNSPPHQPSTISDPNPILISNVIDLPDGINLQYDSIISRISRLASYLRHSPQRREKFIAMVKLVYDDTTSTKATTLLSHV